MTAPQDPFSTAPQDPFRTPPDGASSSTAPGMGGQPAPYGAPGHGQSPAGYGQTAPAYGDLARPPYAGWWRRIGSALIDGLVLLAAAFPFLVLAGVTGELDATEDGSIQGGLFTALAYVAGIAAGVYNLVRQGRTGQTFGKSAVGTRLLKDADGTPVGAGRSILRYVLHLVDQIPLYLGYLWPLWDRKKQTFADKIMSTVVVRG